MALRMMTPQEVYKTCSSEFGTITNTLGKSELEAAAAILVRYYVVHDIKDWAGIKVADLSDFIYSDTVIQEWGKNPFWKPDILGLEKSFISGWLSQTGPKRLESVGKPTPWCINLISNPGLWREKGAGNGKR